MFDALTSHLPWQFAERHEHVPATSAWPIERLPSTPAIANKQANTPLHFEAISNLQIKDSNQRVDFWEGGPSISVVSVRQEHSASLLVGDEIRHGRP
jgi:hypothetical protein